MTELFFWVIMVTFGAGTFWRTMEAIKELFDFDLAGLAVELVVAFICFQIHKWAFIHLVPMQTFFN